MADQKGRELGFYFVPSIGRRGKVEELVGENGDIDPRSGEKVVFCTRRDSLRKALDFKAKKEAKATKTDIVVTEEKTPASA